VNSGAGGEQIAVAVANLDWVTDDLVAQTIEAWQPMSQEPITPDRARSILLTVSQLFDAVGFANQSEAEADA